MIGVAEQRKGLDIDKVDFSKLFYAYNPGSFGSYLKGILSKPTSGGSESQFFTLSGSGSGADVVAQHVASTPNYIIMAGFDDNRINGERTLVYVNYSGSWVKDVQLSGTGSYMDSYDFIDFSAGPNNKLYLLDTAFSSPVFVYSEAGAQLYNWTHTDLSSPESITSDGTYVYILDSSQILKFSLTGALQKKVSIDGGTVGMLRYLA